MSQVKIDGEEVNQPAPQTLGPSGRSRYTRVDALEIDWFATHPRPVETTEEKSDATPDSGNDVPQA